MAEGTGDIFLSDQFLIAILRQTEVRERGGVLAPTSSGDAARARGTMVGDAAQIQFPRSSRLLSRHPRRDQLLPCLGRWAGTVSDLRARELSELEERAPIASNFVDRSTTRVAGLAFRLRRIRALRGIAAYEELRTLPPFWRWILVLDPETAEDLIERIGRSVAVELGPARRDDEARESTTILSAQEALGPGASRAIAPCIEQLRKSFNPSAAKGLGLLAVLWHQGCAAGADRAAQIGRSRVGVIVSGLRPDVVDADGYHQIARLARKTLLRLLTESDSAANRGPVTLGP